MAEGQASPNPNVWRPHTVAKPRYSLALALALHALVIVLAYKHLLVLMAESRRTLDSSPVLVLQLLKAEPERVLPQSERPSPRAVPPAAPVPAVAAANVPVTPTHPALQLATQAAPPAPTAQEWAFASTYTLKNSKGYRYTWGQQVRSMMGTAVEGADQGMVRFRVEIAPDGALAKLETLWSTSATAERLARKAISSMPQWPRTPTGKPLIFEKTISFSPFATDGPPLYKDDCLPDPPAHGNSFAWDGKSAVTRVEAMALEKPDPQALADCLKQLPKDTIEAESARDQRLMDQWGSSKRGQ